MTYAGVPNSRASSVTLTPPTVRAPSLAPTDGRRPEGRDEGVDVDGGLEPRRAAIALGVQRSGFVCAHAYILSGAAAPSRVSPLRKTMQPASARASRAPWIAARCRRDLGRMGWSHASASAARSVTADLAGAVADVRVEPLGEVREGDEQEPLGDVGQLLEAVGRAALDTDGLGVSDEAAQPGVGELGGLARGRPGERPGGLDVSSGPRHRRQGVGAWSSTTSG